MKRLAALLIIGIANSSAFKLMVVAESMLCFGQDIGIRSDVNDGIRRTLMELPNSAGSFAAFKAGVSALAVESFEEYSPLQAVTNISFGTLVASIEGGFVNRPTNGIGHINGAFPISGEQFLFVTGSVSIRFSAPQTAFGLFVTDMEANPLEFSFFGSDSTTNIYTLPARVRNRNSGGCLFFGMIDRDSPFTSLRIKSLGTESYGFDDMVVERVAPLGEPATLSVLSYAGITITGTAEARYRIEASPTPEFITWQTQKVITLPQSRFLYFDEEPILGGRRRYYRVLAAP